MQRVEEIVRDYLASNLNFISSDLHLIEKEFKLTHIAEAKRKGTECVKVKGYIDILARDENGNYVIIEIKRSDKAARETFNEIFTYIQLLKREHGVKDSEIRVILVSSEWKGLLFPFSEVCHKRTYYLEGLEIILDENNKPVDKKLVEPLDVPLSRNISSAHTCFFSLTDNGIEQAISSIRKRMLELGIRDFLIVKILWLEEEVMILLTAGIISDDMEIGYPKKFLAASEKWQIARIDREGFFAKDARLTEALIVTEIIGLQGSSDISYVGNANAKHYPRMKEIEENTCNCLAFNPVWRQHIEHAFASLRARPQDFKSVHVEIYCPQMILETLFHACGDLYEKEKFYRHLPMYAVLINFGEEEHLYRGRVKWSGSTCTFNTVMKDVFGAPSRYLSLRHIGSLAEFDSKVMHLLGLEYTTDLEVKRQGQTQVYRDIRISQGSIQPALRSSSLYLEDFIINAIPFMAELIQFYYSEFVWMS